MSDVINKWIRQVIHVQTHAYSRTLTIKRCHRNTMKTNSLLWNSHSVLRLVALVYFTFLPFRSNRMCQVHRNCSCRRTMRSCPINISGKAERTESSLCSRVQIVLCLRESCCAQHHSPSFSPHFLFAPFLTLNHHAQHAAVSALGASHYVLYGQWVSQWEKQ